jgi:hypothetical protein
MTESKRADAKPSDAKALWAYGYEMIPSQTEHRMTVLRGLVDRQNALAAQDGRTWTARLVTQRVVHVLIVSTSPELDRDINRRLEAELAELGVRYRITLPMRVSDGPDAES